MNTALSKLRDHILSQAKRKIETSPFLGEPFRIGRRSHSTTAKRESTVGVGASPPPSGRKRRAVAPLCGPLLRLLRQGVALLILVGRRPGLTSLMRQDFEAENKKLYCLSSFSRASWQRVRKHCCGETQRKKMTSRPRSTSAP